MFLRENYAFAPLKTTWLAFKEDPCTQTRKRIDYLNKAALQHTYIYKEPCKAGVISEGHGTWKYIVRFCMWPAILRISASSPDQSISVHDSPPLFGINCHWNFCFNALQHHQVYVNISDCVSFSIIIIFLRINRI